MRVPDTILSPLLALFAALAWGGGDFSGGMAAKSAGGTTRGALRVIVAGHAMSLLLLVPGVLLAREQLFPSLVPAVWWGLGAGIAAGLSLTAFYIALATGEMGVSAAVSGLLAAAIPAVVGMALEGRPGWLAMAGFAAAAVAIWLVASTGKPSAAGSRVFALAVLGGLGFGIYFTALRFANPLGVVEPLVLARYGSLFTCGVLLLVLPREKRQIGVRTEFLNSKALAWAVGIATLDTFGNLFFVAATRTGRLDVASVLASLYPASTILLAAFLLHERPTPRQLGGMGLAVVAVALITFA